MEDNNEKKQIKFDFMQSYNTLEILKSEKSKQDSSSPLLDQIINEKGYRSWELWKVMFMVSLVLGIEGMHLTMFSVIFIPFKKYFQTSGGVISVISAMMFISFGVGSLSVGYLNLKFTRIKIIKFSIYAMMILNLALSFMENVLAFTIIRCSLGFFMGLAVPSQLCNLTENLPVYARSFFLCTIWTPFTLGTLYILLIVNFIMPNLEPEKTLTVISLMTIPHILTSILYFFFFKDSPRNLIIQNNIYEGLEMIERIRGSPLEDEEKARIVNEIQQGENSNYEGGNICSMFSPYLRKTTFLLMSIWCINAFIYYCPMIVMSLTLTKLGLSDVQQNITVGNKDVVAQLVTINMISILGYVTAGAASEITFLGRKYCVFLAFIGFAITTLGSLFFPKKFEIFLGIETVFSSITVNVICAYTMEIYPTKIRNVAGGFLYFTARISGFCSQYYGIKLDEINVFTPYYFTLTFASLGALFVFLLPYETQGQFLDNNFSLAKAEKQELENISTLQISSPMLSISSEKSIDSKDLATSSLTSFTATGSTTN